jgi:putative glutamine amidotransferase
MATVKADDRWSPTARKGDGEAGQEMRKPIVGVIGSAHSIHDILNVQHVGEHSLRCISEVADALPLMFEGCPGITDIDALLDTVDGILLTGARANVHPSCFGADPDARYEPYDRDRDAIALPRVRACTDRGVPLLGICRGLQEMNVAFGGSLHPEVRDLPGRMNHRAPRAEDGSLHRDPKIAMTYNSWPMAYSPGSLVAWQSA